MRACAPLTLASLVAVLVAGCASKSDVLTQEGPLGTPGSATNPWTRCSPNADAAWFQQAQLGDSCTFEGGVCGTGDQSGCRVETRTCVNGSLFGVILQTLDCQAMYWRDGSSTPVYADCATALQGARTGDACSWQGACAEPSQQECCVEYASCNVDPGRVVRAQICAPGCTNLAPNAALPADTGCPTEIAGGVANGGLGRSCQGNFVCVGGKAGMGDIPTDSPADLTWCDHGVVVGGSVMSWVLQASIRY
jgi:hypothetical protein